MMDTYRTERGYLRTYLSSINNVKKSFELVSSCNIVCSRNIDRRTIDSCFLEPFLSCTFRHTAVVLDVVIKMIFSSPEFERDGLIYIGSQLI